jgi:glycosyltransferase involved in cell wall biosynthesis
MLPLLSNRTDMLSILLPVYNTDCRRLVVDLVDQCRQAGIEYEVLIMDDASTLYRTENREIATLEGCRWIESAVNQKQAKVRNQLASMARFPYLLFLDADLEIRDDRFIARYLEALGMAPVLVGAVIYPHERPAVGQRLRWVYGRRRECQPVAERNLHPWTSLSSQNFLMERGVFERVPFDERFQTYGHEDTVLGYRLKKEGIGVRYIDNPLIHRTADSDGDFLRKSLLAVEKYRSEPFVEDDALVAEVRLFRAYRTLLRWKAVPVVRWLFRRTQPWLRLQLCGKRPNLWVFDAYRLGYLCHYLNATNA